MTITAKALAKSQFVSGSDGTIYTCNVTATLIDKFTANNTDSGAQTLTVNVVPSGGSVAASNQLVSAYSIAAGTFVDLTHLKNLILNNGDFISVKAGTGSKIVVNISGREVS
jgi:hypothetical protein